MFGDVVDCDVLVEGDVFEFGRDLGVCDVSGI